MSERRWIPNYKGGIVGRQMTDAEVLTEMGGQYTDWCTHHDTHHRPYEHNRACRLIPIWIVGLPSGKEEDDDE